jgi:hypothetical protein
VAGGAYYLLALAEFLLKMAFIKSEFMFWKNIDQNKGVSLKTLFFELGAKIIFILYLYEYKSSIILFFDSLDLLITLISRTFCLKLTPGFPFLRLATSDVYKQREAIDNQSIWYMNYLLLPLMGCYLTYALYTKGAESDPLVPICPRHHCGLYRYFWVYLDDPSAVHKLQVEERGPPELERADLPLRDDHNRRPVCLYDNDASPPTAALLQRR